MLKLLWRNPHSSVPTIAGMNRSKLDTLFHMSGRVVIVTGGTRGTGLALAEGYATAATHLGDIESLRNLVARTVEASGFIFPTPDPRPPTPEVVIAVEDLMAGLARDAELPANR